MATAPTDATDAEGLLRCARQALSELKTEPPGSAAFLRGPMRARFESRRAAIALVQQAAREGRILAHYQPKVRLETRQLAGYEALARIRAADGTVTGPEVWGAALDDVDCARLVDVEVLDAVLSDLVTDAARLIRVGVNFSEYSLRSVDFADRLLARIASRGLAPALLELEVVETVLVGQRMGPLAQGFARLRAAGMRIALDDFGTGFASLSHLRDLPIDRIKLDKSFVLGLGADHRNAPILRAIIDLACLLGLETVAEGIETDEAMVFLRGLGCREGQGFRFGPARPLAELPDPRQATNPRPKPGNSWASRQVSKLKGTAWWS
jgi:EAL domain-containing protein (putative c-di-GMP-specific phosphodiesterase class I)